MSESTDGAFEDLERKLTAALIQTTRCAGQLASEDLAFVRTATPELGKVLDKQKTRLLSTVRRLVRTAVIDTELPAPSLLKAENLEDEWRGLVDVVDNLLEKADICLDQYTGATKAHTVPAPEATDSKVNVGHDRRTENLVKPQKSFANPPQNNISTPFKPLLLTKPHAIIPLQESIEPVDVDGSEQEALSNGVLRAFRHPYEAEIKQFRYPAKVYTSSEPIQFLPFESTSATWVDTMNGVREMLAELKEAQEIAIDLEHHEKRTYIGVVSLMQISTRTKDWIVDTLKPWREDLQVLNEVFTDPNIVKVLHGAHMDAIWLQRDLGLYLVGLFDTYHASRSLGYPRHSLAFLLQKFVNFEAQKQYQMADWRIRPLTEEMFSYARADTHFLLFVYDNMRNELLSRANGGPALIDDVLEESKKFALQRYERPTYDPEFGLGERGWYYMLVKTPAVFSKEQFSVFRAVHRWRDQLARKEDESPAYLMSTTTLFNIARDMPSALPALQALLTRRVDPVNTRVSELLKVIQEAKSAGEEGPQMNDFMANHPGLADYQAKRAARREGYRAAAAVAAAAQQDISIAGIAKQELLSISGDDLKIRQSLFWGNTVKNNEHNHDVFIEVNSNLPQFQVPLPNLTAEVFATDGEPVDEPSNQTMPPPEHAFVRKQRFSPQAEEEVFTLKEKGGSRKRKVVDSSVSRLDADGAGQNETGEADFEKLGIETVNGNEKESSQSKKKKSRSKRKNKLAEQRANGTGDAGREADTASEAFDYANAPSVLHAKQDSTNLGKGKNRAPVINPYAKSMDAPKGLPKKKDMPGKSATFKS